MVKIFISYRRDDSAYVAAAINERLSDRFGSDAVFFDIDKIPLGRDFRTYIADQVGQCNVVLAVIADQWLTTSPAGARRLDAPTDYVRVELESALAHGKTVVPVLVGNAEMPSADELPESLKDLPFLNAAEVRPGRDLAAHIERLLEGVVSIVQPEAGPEPKPSVPSPRAAKHARSSHPGPRTVLQRTLSPKLWLTVVLMVIGSLLLAWGVAVLVEAATTTATATYFGYIPTVVIGAIATAVVGYRMWKAP